MRISDWSSDVCSSDLYVARDTRQLAFSMPKAVDQTILRIRFDSSGNVSDVYKMGLEHVAKISPEGETTTTLVRDRGLFQEIFGMIGAVGAEGAGSGPTGPGTQGAGGGRAWATHRPLCA